MSPPDARSRPDRESRAAVDVQDADPTVSPIGPRVRLLRRVVLTATTEGLDFERIRQATKHVRAGDDVIVCIRGWIDSDPGAADVLGQCLAAARTVTVEAGGSGARQFAVDLEHAAQREAAW